MSRRGIFVTLLGIASAGLTLDCHAWTEYGGPGGRHYSPLSEINRANVVDLEIAWHYHSEEMERVDPREKHLLSFQATPLKLPDELGGNLVLCTPLSRVVALDPLSGEERWQFDPQIQRGSKRPFNCRGLALWQDQAERGKHCSARLFLASYDRRLIALDARSGKRCLAFGRQGEVDLRSADDSHPRDEVTQPSPAIVVDDRVIVGSGVIDFAKAVAPRGTVQAFDTRSGRPVWSFEPIPAAAEPGEWPDDPLGHSGAANVWAPMSADRERGLVFLPTSAPSPDYYGADRPGDNRHANSVVALRASDGELVWSYQVVHHDLWDYDMPAQPILIDIDHAGRRVPALIQLTKQGLVFVLNRETGEPLWPIEERPVSQQALPGEYPAATQPYPLQPPPLLPDTLQAEDAWGLTFWDRGHCRQLLEQSRHQGLFTPITEQWTLMLPGSLGGPNWGGGAYDPASGLLMINYNTVPTRSRLVRRSTELEGGSVNIEQFNWRMAMSGTPYDMETGMLVSPLGIPCSAPPWGKLAALDVAAGTWRWQVALGSIHDSGPLPLPFEIPWGTPNLGGGLVTGSGVLLIASTMDRSFRAFDTLTGRQLWRHKLPADGYATPMTYQAGGHQYVVIAAGGHYMFSHRPRGDSLIAFTLPK